jgi:hypothetical protein
MRRRSLQIGLLLVSLVVIGAIGLPLAAQTLAAQQQQQRAALRADALRRWQAAGIHAYSLDIRSNQCSYRAHVRGQMDEIDGLQPGCTFQPSRVDGLFELGAMDGISTPLCNQRGCPCESTTSVHTAYDQQLGYPTALVIEVDLHPTWFAQDFWRELLSQTAMPPCLSRSTTTIQVTRFIPG